MPLLKSGRQVEDPWKRVGADEPVPEDGPVIVDLARWKAERASLLARKAPLGVLLESGTPAEEIADDLGQLALVALEFPRFNDGRSYSTARVLRERYGFVGELRAVGDVLLEQLHFMDRAGFDAFEIDSEHPEQDWRIAQSDMSVWYQPAADRRPTAIERRRD